MDETRKSNVLEDDIIAMVKETEARHCVLFSGLNIGLTNIDKHVLGCGAQRHKL